MSKHILIIDPSLSFTKYLEVVLDRLGFSSMTARNAGDGLQILRGRIPDLIITEAILPDMDGMELCQRIKKSPRTAKIPILVVTVDFHAAEGAGGQGSPFEESITKPVSVRDLYDALQRHLEPSSGRKNMRAAIAARVSFRDGTHYRSHITLNVGEGGMFVESENPHPRGAVIDTELLLPGVHEPLLLRSEVVFSVAEQRGNHPPGMGMKFVEMDAGARALLTSYVEGYLTGTLPGAKQALNGGLVAQG